MSTMLIPKKPWGTQLWERSLVEVYCLFEDPEHYHAFVSEHGRWVRRAFPKSYWEGNIKKENGE